MRFTRPAFAMALTFGLGLVVWSSGCSGTSGSGFDNGKTAGTGNGKQGGSNPGFGTGTSDGAQPGCVGLQCQEATCSGGATTSISGTVYDPAGKNPLYGVVVYIPNAPVQALPTGATCDSCDALFTGSPMATTLTDAAGKFTLKNAPQGQNIPLVVQIGKWRKQLKIPAVTACQDNAVPDKSVTLPKNHVDGDIPNIAISTGSADSLECLLKRVGLEAAEYGAGASGQGRIHIFQGGGGGGHHGGGAPNTQPPGPSSSQSLWDTQADLMKYDMVLFSCEGSETSNMNQQALFDYAAAGGRVFASHFHYAWFNSGPFGSANLATWYPENTPGAGDMGDIMANVVTTFPKGQALQQWLGNVNALTNGELPILQARHNADVAKANTASQPWIVADQNAKPPGATEYFTFNTPLAAAPEKQCGRVVFSDLHVGAASSDYNGGFLGGKTVPDGCADKDLSPQEKALEFMLFDLSSCVTPDSQPPQPPPAVK